MGSPPTKYVLYYYRGGARRILRSDWQNSFAARDGRCQLQGRKVMKLRIGMADVNQPRVFIQEPADQIHIAGLNSREDGLSCRVRHAKAPPALPRARRSAPP
jgi:hypothetical protein